MKKIYIIAGVAAVLCGILLYSFFSSYEKQAEVKSSAEAGETEPVVVAAVDIPAYTEITSDMVKVTNMIKGSAHPNAARSLDEVVGKVIDSKLVPNEQVIMSKLGSEENSGLSLSYQLPKGMRAMTVPVDVNSGVGGYIEKGDLVDILVYISQTGSDKISVDGAAYDIDKSANYVALQAIEVLKTGEVTSAGGLYSNITLLLTPKQCMILNNARKISGDQFTLTLRRKGEKDKVNGKPRSTIGLVKEGIKSNGTK